MQSMPQANLTKSQSQFPKIIIIFVGVHAIFVLQHEDYNFFTYSNDIALIHLPQPVDLTPEEVGTICLPYHGSANNYTENSCWASGWGLDESMHYI